MSSITINTPTLLLLIFSFGVYFYLNDRLSKPHTADTIQTNFKRAFGNETTHTFVQMIGNYTNIFSGAAATATFSVFYNLPVIRFRSIFGFFILIKI